MWFIIEVDLEGNPSFRNNPMGEPIGFETEGDALEFMTKGNDDDDAISIIDHQLVFLPKAVG